MSTPDYDRLKLERRKPELQTERREQERAEAELACRERGTAYRSRSCRKFRAAIVAEPERNGKHVDGTQLLLALCDLHEKPARRRADRSREAVLAELEKRGAAALEAQADHSKRVLDSSLARQGCGGRTGGTWGLIYESTGGEILEVVLHGLTAAELDHVRAVTLNRAPVRTVVWPSQVTNAVVEVSSENA